MTVSPENRSHDSASTLSVSQVRQAASSVLFSLLPEPGTHEHQSVAPSEFAPAIRSGGRTGRHAGLHRQTCEADRELSGNRTVRTAKQRGHAHLGRKGIRREGQRHFQGPENRAGPFQQAVARSCSRRSRYSWNAGSTTAFRHSGRRWIRRSCGSRRATARTTRIGKTWIHGFSIRRDSIPAAV